MNVGEVAAVTFALQAFVTLFVIMDPPGSIPIFLGHRTRSARNSFIGWPRRHCCNNDFRTKNREL